MTTNHEPLSASLAASLPSILFFSFPAPLKPPHPFPSPPVYHFNFRYTAFSLSVFQSNSDPPNHQRLGAVHLFVTPRSLLCEPDPCLADRRFISRTLESSQYPFLFSKPFVYKAQSCLDYPHATTAPNSRSSLIHQLLGVTLVVAAVSLQHKSVTGAFV